MRITALFLTCFLITGWMGPAAAQMQHHQIEKSANGETTREPLPFDSIQITPIGNCFAQFSKEEVMDMRRHARFPYKECQRRLAEKQKQAQQKKSESEKPENTAEKETKEQKE